MMTIFNFLQCLRLKSRLKMIWETVKNQSSSVCCSTLKSLNYQSCIINLATSSVKIFATYQRGFPCSFQYFQTQQNTCVTFLSLPFSRAKFKYHPRSMILVSPSNVPCSSRLHPFLLCCATKIPPPRWAAVTLTAPAALPPF